jgi:hypothetical protein
VKYSYNGMEIHIVLVVTTNWEQGHFVDGGWERNTGKRPSSGIKSSLSYISANNEIITSSKSRD